MQPVIGLLDWFADWLWTKQVSNVTKLPMGRHIGNCLDDHSLSGRTQ